MLPEPPEVKASVSVIVLFTVAALFARSALQIHLAGAGYDAALAADLSFFVMLPIIAILMWPLLSENRAAMLHWFRPPASWLALIAYSVLIGLLLRITYWASLTAGITFGWLPDFSYAIVNTPQFSFSCPPAPLLELAIVVRVLLTPVFEEFIHRGYIFAALLPRGKIPAVILSALLFGLMHHSQTIITAFLTGLILADLTLRLRSLWGPITVHATFNLLAIFDRECLHANWNPAATASRNAVATYIASATTIACVALLWRLLQLAKAGTRIAPRP